MTCIIRALPWCKRLPLWKHSCFEIHLISAYKQYPLMKKCTPHLPNRSVGIQESNIYFWWQHFTLTKNCKVSTLFIYQGPLWLPAFNLKLLAPCHAHSTGRKTDFPTSFYPWSQRNTPHSLDYCSSPTIPCSTLNSPLLSRNDLNCTWYLGLHATFLLSLL